VNFFLKIRFGHKTLVLCFKKKKFKNLLSIIISSLPDLSGKMCCSFDVSEITGTDGSLILICFLGGRLLKTVDLLGF